MKSTIACPVCGAAIPFDPVALASGSRFSCPSCPESTIGIESESLDKVKRTLHELLKLREQAGRGGSGTGVDPSPFRRS